MKQQQPSDELKNDFWELGLKVIEQNRRDFFGGKTIKKFVRITGSSPLELKFSKKNQLPEKIKKELVVLFSLIYS